MHTTNRTRSVACPACEGEGGQVEESYAGYDDYNGPAIREEWIPCEACEGEGTVQRVDRLAWLIGEERRGDAALALHAAMLASQKANAAWNAARAAVRMVAVARTAIAA